LREVRGGYRRETSSRQGRSVHAIGERFPVDSQTASEEQGAVVRLWCRARAAASVARWLRPAKQILTICALAFASWLSACSVAPPPLQRATLLAERGRTPEAIRVLEAYLTAHPAEQAERRLLIRLYGSSGDFAAAAAQTERLAEVLPANSPLPWVELGAAFELGHRYDEALAAYDRAASIAPRDPLGPKRGGMRAARWGELDLAEPRLREAVRRAAGDAEAWHALGVVLLGLNRLDAARQAYSAGIAADERALENRLGLATVALRQDEPRVALAQYESLLEARPKFTEALLGKSWCLILLGEYVRAAAALNEAERLGADRTSITRQRAELSAREHAR
jgi:tetratricopeptide (TPR) repeat protein